MNKSNLTEEDLAKVIKHNVDLTFLLGVSSSIIMGIHEYCPLQYNSIIKWFMESIENLIYLDKPLTPMPED